MVALDQMTNFYQLASTIIDVAWAAIWSLLLSVLLTPVYTNLAYRYKWWKKARRNAVTGEKAPVFYKLHAAKHKRNIPTMAGIVIVVSVSLVTLLMNLDRGETWLLLAGMLLFGGLGLADDISNVFLRADKRGGLTPSTQILALVVLAGIAGWWFHYKLGYSQLNLPWLGVWHIGWLYLPLFMTVVVSTAKSVSITDGLDGLAGGLLTIAFAIMALLSILQGNYKIAIFCGSVVGTMLSYTWFNVYPARFFMGQTGSTALGAVLGMVAMLNDAIFILPIVGGVFVMEAGSSLLQVASKKLRGGRKIFLSAPIHHHFEALGWPETKVTMRFWILGGVFGTIGLILAINGGVI